MGSKDKQASLVPDAALNQKRVSLEELFQKYLRALPAEAEHPLAEILRQCGALARSVRWKRFRDIPEDTLEWIAQESARRTVEKCQATGYAFLPIFYLGDAVFKGEFR